MSRRLGALLACAGLVLAVAAPANAGEKLTIPTARERAAAFAESTCKHDASCAKSGVQTCRRSTAHVVFCRIFDHRKTDAQGNFLCTRWVRLSLQLPSRKVPVTGVSEWDC